MNKAFYAVISAQFFSSLADNALLIVAIGLLRSLSAPVDLEPSLRSFFVIAYVVLAAFAGTFADSLPKGKVMFLTNMIKIFGCLLMLFSSYIVIEGAHPWTIVVVAYAIIGIGAAAYSPAKYGIITELLPADRLVFANGWIEGLTVLSILLGTVLGGFLINPEMVNRLLILDFPLITTGIDTPAESAISVIAVFYFVAALLNLMIPDTGKKYQNHTNPILIVKEFYGCVGTLWRDPLGQISLAITSLFWGAGATLQFIVMKWAEVNLHMPLSKASMLQGVVAIGVAFGAVAAARYIPLKRSPSVLIVGLAMGALIPLMNFIENIAFAVPILIAIGLASGFFVVPMNALLQHRGYTLMGAGRSIAVQNFNENIGILVMLEVYAFMLKLNWPLTDIIMAFGLFITVNVFLIMKLYQRNARRQNLEELMQDHAQ